MKSQSSVFKVGVFEDEVNLLYYFLFHPLQHNSIIFSRSIHQLLQKLGDDSLGLEERFIEVGLLLSISQRVHLLGTRSD